MVVRRLIETKPIEEIAKYFDGTACVNTLIRKTIDIANAHLAPQGPDDEYPSLPNSRASSRAPSIKPSRHGDERVEGVIEKDDQGNLHRLSPEVLYKSCIVGNHATESVPEGPFDVYSLGLPVSRIWSCILPQGEGGFRETHVRYSKGTMAAVKNAYAKAGKIIMWVPKEKASSDDSASKSPRSIGTAEWTNT